MGKTLTAIVAAMESKRLGFTKKAMFVVPNHTLSNWQIVNQAPRRQYPAPRSVRSDERQTLGIHEQNCYQQLGHDPRPIFIFQTAPVSSDTLKDFYLRQINGLEERIRIEGR